ncbi:type II toxin-antitoxin system PemK/MazF family toxin [Acetobacter garciniae]|uniref:type II toxin-antitoxin system PemK/MazF family toxin n=1 Tax=Acetobacter garciniae TaxID=2817435 RepID=UPI002EDB3C40
MKTRKLMPGFEVWDIIKVPFPYTNRPVRQQRPALVVRVVVADGAPDLLWVLMVTSSAHRQWPQDVVITDFAAAGLPAPSMVRTAKIATIDASDAQAIGKLPTGNRVAVKAVLAEALSALPNEAAADL